MKKVFLALMAVAAIALTGCVDDYTIREYNYNIANSTDRVVAIMTGYMEGETFMLFDDKIVKANDTVYDVMLDSRSSNASVAIVVGNAEATYPTTLEYLEAYKDKTLSKVYPLDPIPNGKKIYVSIKQDGNHTINYAD